MKPILFNTEMVRAILDGRKTVTRRPVKKRYSNTDLELWRDGKTLCEKQNKEVNQPYSVGDILYVRETWGFDKNNWLYKAEFSDADNQKLKNIMRWRPSIHMPKEAARIFIKVTDVRVARLRDIGIKDVECEGIDIGDTCRACIAEYGTPCCKDDESECGVFDDVVCNVYSDLWDSIYYDRGLGWSANPWVWRIKFERCERPDPRTWPNRSRR